MPTPEYIQDFQNFRSIIWEKLDVSDEPQNVPQNKASLRRISLIDAVIANPTISKEELSEKLGVTVMTIKRDLVKLRETYSIEWQDPAKGGRWCVKKREQL